MIVPTMSKEEIIKEMLSDFDIVKRKSEYVIQDLRRLILKTKNFPIVKAYDYVTPKTKNKWIYIVEVKTKDDIFQTFVNYHFTSIGLMAALVATDMSITFYTSHFFTRFIEREKLSITKPEEMIKAFFTMNPVIKYEVQKKLEDGANEILGAASTGVVLGIRSNKKIIVCNTYIPNEMLHKDQSLIVNSLKSELDYYTAMKEAGLI